MSSDGPKVITKGESAALRPYAPPRLRRTRQLGRISEEMAGPPRTHGANGPGSKQSSNPQQRRLPELVAGHSFHRIITGIATCLVTRATRLEMDDACQRSTHVSPRGRIGRASTRAPSTFSQAPPAKCSAGQLRNKHVAGCHRSRFRPDRSQTSRPSARLCNGKPAFSSFPQPQTEREAGSRRPPL